MKKMLAMLLALVMMFALVACGETEAEEEDVEEEVEAEATAEEEEDEATEEEEDADEADEEEESAGSSFSAKDAIKIDELDWSFSYAIVDGDQFVSLDYTNNSSYTILDFEIEMTRKDDVTDEEMLSVYGTETNEYHWDEDEILEFYITAENRRCADPGETVTECPCYIRSSYVYVETMDQVDLMEPDNATIVFLGGDGYMYITYYSFATDTYGTESSGGIEAVQWSDSEISSLVPKADYPAVILSYDEEDRFTFYAYGVSWDDFDEYVESVQEYGFTDISSQGSYFFHASNGEGANVDLSYTALEETMFLRLELEEEEEEEEDEVDEVDELDEADID